MTVQQAGSVIPQTFEEAFERVKRRLGPMFRDAGYRANTGFPSHLTTYAPAEPLP